MKILSVMDPSFQNYGQVLGGYDVKELLETLDKVTPCPEGVEYVPEQPELQALAIEKDLRNNAYGGMPIQIGWCNGHNTKMNCLEYHRDSELNVGTEDSSCCWPSVKTWWTASWTLTRSLPICAPPVCWLKCMPRPCTTRPAARRRARASR